MQDGKDYGMRRASSEILKARIQMEKMAKIDGANKDKSKVDGTMSRKDDKSLKHSNAPKVSGDNSRTLAEKAVTGLNTKDAKELDAKNAPKVRGDNSYGAKHDGEFKQGSVVLDKRADKSGKEAKAPAVDSEGNPKIDPPKTKNFLKGLKKGALHKELGIKEGTKIPVSKLEEASRSSDPLKRKRAIFALNARKFNK
jgi:hypothetical protein